MPIAFGGVPVSMLYSLLRDFAVVLHLTFIFYALLGGLLVPRWQHPMRLHVPAMGWIALNQFFAWSCRDVEFVIVGWAWNQNGKFPTCAGRVLPKDD